MRSVAGSLAMLTGCLAAERLSVLLGLALCKGSLDTDSATSARGDEVGFTLSSTVSSSISRCACYSPIRVGASL